MKAPESARFKLLPARTACAALMALLMLALLGFVQADISSSTAAASGGSGISAARQSDTVAPLRSTAKAQAVEVRAGRPLPVKFVSGHCGIPAPASDFLVVAHARAVGRYGVQALATAPHPSANQPRAPPAA